LQEIRLSFPDVPVLVLTMYDDEIYLKEALRLGAHGLVLKQTDPYQLLTAIRTLIEGKKYFDTTFTEETILRFQHEITKEESKSLLTAREEEVLR
ncbi:response regulator transcription factor, partial [Klebsiella pneumoniae]|nr:response regulator transcription factor [Klebsiella pneumoniae]